ncbi:hypothetical protein [Pseudomonas sp. TH10]|uniref:hypothetical protein n=1 Tax=Pseudomonas sp. TH10 TaxID=2796376 RepID=UPI0019113096|nr:hypothetical protein [Pseudomonas sp. TH10]MBK5518873.1 hypothetical protein [Pseudomonas sp. TH10]
MKTQLLQLETERRRALVEEDYARVAELFADDLVYVHTTRSTLLVHLADFRPATTQVRAGVPRSN